MATITGEPTVLSSDIAVDSKPLGLKSRDHGAYQRYHSGISPDVAKLMKTRHFQAKVREVLPRREFALSRDVQIRVKDSGSILIREKDGDPWIKIYKKSELESTELDEPIDEIVRKTREAFDGLFPEDPRNPEPLIPDRVSASSPHHCCAHHHSPESLHSRDELIRDLRDEVRDLRREIEKLKESDSRPPAFKVATLEHGLRSATGRIETLPDMDPTLLAQNEELRRQRVEIHGLRQDLTQANQDKAALLLLLTAANEWNRTLQDQLQTTTEELGLTQESLETVLESVDQLKEENSELGRTLEQRTEHLTKMLGLFLATGLMYQQSQAKVAELQEESSQLRADNTLLTQNLDQRTKQLQGTLVLLTLVGALNQQNQEELRTLHDLHGEVSEEKEELTHRLASAKEEVRRLSEVELPREREARELLQSRLEEAQHQVEELTPKLESATKRVAELEELLRSKDEEVSSLTVEAKRLQRELDEARESHQEELKQLRREFTSEKERLSSEYEQREKELTERHELRVHELEESAKKLGTQLETATQRAEKAERLLEEKASELLQARKEFETQLHEKDEEIRITKAATKQAQSELREAQSSHERELKRLRLEFTSEKDRLSEQHEEEIRRLSSSHEEDLEQKLREQQETFDKASRELEEKYQVRERELHSQLQLAREEFARQRDSYERGFSELEQSYKRSEAKLTEEFQLALQTLGLEKKEALARAAELQERASGLEKVLREAQEKLSDLPASLVEELDESPFPGKHIAGKIEHLLQENRRLEMEMEELQDQLREAKDSHSSERERVDESHRQELERLAQEHQKQILALQSEIEESTDEIGRLRKKVSGLTSAQIHDKQKLHLLEEAHQELLTELQEVERRVDSRDKTIERLQGKISEVERESEEKDKVISSYNAELIKYADQIKELRRTVQQRDKQIEELGQTLSEVERESEYYYSELRTQRQENRRASELLDVKSQRVVELEKALDQKSREFDEYQNEAQVLIEKIEREAEQSNSKLLFQISTLEETLEQKEHRVSELEEENLALRATVERQEKELVALRKEVRELRVENRELWEILGRLAAVLNVSIKVGDLEGTKRAIWEATDQLIEANQSLEKTSAFAQHALKEVAGHLGLKSADPHAIHERLEGLLRVEKQFDLHRKEKELALRKLAALSKDVGQVKAASKLDVGESSSEPSKVAVASQQIVASIGKLLHGIGSERVQLTELSSRQAEAFTYNKEAISHPDRIHLLDRKVTPIVRMAEAKAKSSNHKGFNAVIYEKNSLLDFIDRVDYFILRNESAIQQISSSQRELQELVAKAQHLSRKGTSMSLEELRAVQETLSEIQTVQRRRQVLVQRFFKALLNTIIQDAAPGKNRLTGQLSTGSGFPMFGKDLMAYFQAFSQLDTSYYIDGDRRNGLIRECDKAQEFRVLVETLHQSLGALFSKVEL